MAKNNLCADVGAASPLNFSAVIGSLFYVALLSADHVARKYLLSSFTSFGANALVFFTAGFLLYCIGRYKKIAFTLPRDISLFWIIANGIFFSGMVISLQIGLLDSSAGLANAIFCSYPVITYLISLLIMKEDSFALSKIVGFFTVFTGFYLLVMNPSGNHISSYIFLATFFMGSQLCILRKLVKQYGVIYIVAWQHFITGLICGIIAEFVGFVKEPLLGNEHWEQVAIAFFYITVPVNVVACLVQGLLVKKYLASQISSFMLFRPILGFVIAAYFLSEPLTMELLIAAVIVGVGVLLIFCGDSIFGFCKKFVG